MICPNCNGTRTVPGLYMVPGGGQIWKQEPCNVCDRIGSAKIVHLGLSFGLDYQKIDKQKPLPRLK